MRSFAAKANKTGDVNSAALSVALLHHEMRLLYFVEGVALFAHGFDVARHQLAFEHMAFKFNRIACVEFVHALEAFGVDINVRAGAVLKKAVTFCGVKPLHCCLHNFWRTN
jgi:hypothetical protein